MNAHRALVFHVQWQNPALESLLAEFRLIVNESIRIALRGNIKSRGRLARTAYQVLGQRHRIHKAYILSAFDVALSQLKAYRRQAKRGRYPSVPFMHRPMLKAANQTYWLDRETGRLRIPIRGTEGVQFRLPVSEWHRSFLRDTSWGLGSLTLIPGQIIIVVRRQAPSCYEPTAAVALDTNEDSMDGIIVSDRVVIPTVLGFGGVRRIQDTHFRRRRRIATRKGRDRRVSLLLLQREGLREKNRVRQRLHLVTKRLVQFAESRKAAIVLEDLSRLGRACRSQQVSRRLATWPRGQLHRQIEYKAALAGVPVIKVNPAWTSKTCPACGARRRDRVGKEFVCLMCDWEMDRQINAGLNILKTALASNEALARGVWFHLGALRHDVMIPFHHLLRKGGDAWGEPSGVELL